MNNFKAKEFESKLLSEKYVRYTHSSGLDVFIFPKKMSTVYALFGVKYGSVDNSFITPDGKEITVPDGIAHFLEHKLFTNEDGSDSFERFSDYGADANAYTSFNKTAYLFSCSDELESSLGELIDFVTHPYFTPDSVESEIGIIAEEIRMYDDNPGDRCFYGMLEGMYKSHSIRRNICGTKASISKITADTLYDCYRSFYRPNNMALVICGDVDAERLLNLIDVRLPKSFCGSSVTRVNENQFEAPCVLSEYTERQMQVSKPIFSIGFKDTDISDDPRKRLRKDALMAIVNEILFSRAGDFYSSLFERKIISPAFSYGYTISASFAYNSLAGEADDPRLVLDEVKKHIEDVKRTGLDRGEFERAKRVMYAESVKLFDSVESIANALFSAFCEDEELFEYAEIISGITYEDAQKQFEEFFDNYSATLSVVSPITH